MSGNSNDYILKADDSLKKKIGVPLSMVITESKIKAAEKVVEESVEELIQRCIQDAKGLKEKFTEIYKNQSVTIDSLQPLNIVVLGIKSLAGQAGYPVASEIARSMFEYIESLKELNPKTLSLVKLHIDAIYAVFSESKSGLDDTVSLEVLNTLKAAIGK